MGLPTLRASVLVLLLVQSGWCMLAGQCIPEEKIHEAIECCKVESYIPKDITEKCIQHVRTTNSPHRSNTRNSMICLINCTFNAMGLITASGAVDAEKFMPYIATFDESLRKVMTSAVLTCANSTDDIMRDIQDWKSSCNAFPLMFDVCVSQYSLENCPAERFTSSPVCNLVKTGAPVC